MVRDGDEDGTRGEHRMAMTTTKRYVVVTKKVLATCA